MKTPESIDAALSKVQAGLSNITTIAYNLRCYIETLELELDLLRQFRIKYIVVGYKGDNESPAYISEEHDTFDQALADAHASGLITRIEVRREITKDERTKGWLLKAKPEGN